MIKLFFKITKILITLLISLFIFSCVNTNFNKVSGKGNVVTTKRNTSEFNAIKAQNGLDVLIEQANTYLIEVEADENLQKHIFTEVEGQTLKVYTDVAINNAEMKEIHIKAPHFTKIDASSGAFVKNKNILNENKLELETSSGSSISIHTNTSSLFCDSSSGSSINVKGKTKNLTTESSSGSTINLKELNAEMAKSNSSSGSSTTLKATTSFIGDASSGSSIVCYGSPTQFTKDESSGGSVTIK